METQIVKICVKVRVTVFNDFLNTYLIFITIKYII